MICITNTLPNKLEVYIDNDTHELRSGETMVLAPSKTAFKCQVKINCESNIKIAWLALWTGVFTGEQIKPKIICNSEFTFEGIDGEITFYRSTSRPANEICCCCSLLLSMNCSNSLSANCSKCCPIMLGQAAGA